MSRGHDHEIPVRNARDKRRVFEAALIFLASLLLAGLLLHLTRIWLDGYYDPLVPIASHIPILLLPWLWLKYRIMPRDSRFRIGGGSPDRRRRLLMIGAWFLPLMLVLNWDTVSAPPPEWFEQGVPSIVLELFFQGLFVGLSEEILMRACLQQTLSEYLTGGIRLLWWRLPHAVWLTALAFGAFHLSNLGHQPLSDTLFQALFACFVGLVIGGYYQRTRSLAGAVALHAMVDLPGVILVLLFK